MAHFPQPDIVVIGASSGGLEPLIEIVRRLPPDLPAALFVVVHMPADHPSYLPEILSRSGRLPAKHPTDGEKFQRGHIYVAPPDFHLLLARTHVQVVRGPRENHHRPAIDPLFRSAAVNFGARVIAVVLSGALDDGTAGLFAVKRRGGLAIVQDPNDALFPDMPRNALAAVPVDYRLDRNGIAKTIADLACQRAASDQGARVAEKEDTNEDAMERESELEALAGDSIDDQNQPGTPSVYGCPDCGGTLRELHEDEWLRFRCRVGHAFSAEGLLRAQGASLESALWSAFRTLNESAALSRRLAERARANKHFPIAEKFATKSRIAAEQAKLLRDLLLTGRPKSEERSSEQVSETEELTAHRT